MGHPPEPDSTLAVDLCYPEPPGLTPAALLRGARSHFPGTQLVWGGRSSMVLRHDRTDPDAASRPDPTEILGLPPENSPLSAADPATGGHLLHAVSLAPEADPVVAGHDLTQSWRWPEADAALERCRFTVSIVQLVGRGRPVGDRLRAFKAVLSAAVTLARPLATWWPGSQQALPPGALVSHPLTGVVNVRTFRSVDDPNVTVTDTLGMHVMGLPDLQCQSRHLDPERLSDLLLRLAEYVLDEGVAVPVGQRVPGIAPDQVFTIGRGGATVPPLRAVLDLDPGPPYAIARR